MAWIEGLTSSNRLLQDLAKILTQANKDTGGLAEADKNFGIVYPRPFDLTEVAGESLVLEAGKIYKANKANWWDKKKVVIHETIATVTNTVDEQNYTVDYVTGKVTFSATPTGTLTIDYTFKTNESLATAFAKIGPNGRIVLKTKTTPVVPPSGSDPFNTDPDLSISELTMFMEIEKPKLLIDPESGQVATRYGTQQTIENHYYVNVRIFDRYDYVTEKPVDKVVDVASGLTTDEGAHISSWSKFSWYQDFKEQLVDALDDDPGTDNLNDGIVFTYLETPGLYGEVPIQYWISTNNDRLAMVLMGEPSINYDNYLVSFAYAGKIDSFEGGKNDTAGNYALSVGSSTIPSVAQPNPDPITSLVVFTPAPTLVSKGSGPNSGVHIVSYKVVAVNASGISMPTAAKQTNYTFLYNSGSGGQNEVTDITNFKLTFQSIPENATSVRIYRKDITVNGAGNTADIDWLFEGEITRTAALAGAYTSQQAQDNTKPCPVTNYDAATAGVVRDGITGAVIEVRPPQQWGKNTATGVNDITMYKTRSGVFYQRHQVSFITPEQFMKKDAFNPSRWTGKFHLSPMYVVHGYDGYRGWLKDVVVVDDSSIVHLDELIVNKGQSDEKIYKYFKLTAPFSLMTNSANTNYGIGILKV